VAETSLRHLGQSSADALFPHAECLEDCWSEETAAARRAAMEPKTRRWLQTIIARVRAGNRDVFR
jgi:hypothetical protein